MSKVIEKERKWLLKRVPNDMYNMCDKHEHIEQFYTKDGWRYRYTINDDSTETFIKLKKIPIERGINHEIDVTVIDREEYYRIRTDAERYISKDRLTLAFEGRVIEVDDFDNIRLCVVEVEDVDVTDTVVFPPAIEELVLMEVTGNPKFSNYNLADKEDDNE